MKILILMMLFQGLMISCATSQEDDGHSFTVVVEREVYTCIQQDSGEYSCDPKISTRNKKPVVYQPGERQ
jgi:hypothetical protein